MKLQCLTKVEIAGMPYIFRCRVCSAEQLYFHLSGVYFEARLLQGPRAIVSYFPESKADPERLNEIGLAGYNRLMNSFTTATPSSSSTHSQGSISDIASVS